MSAPLLEVKGLTKAFGGIRAVDDLSFTVAPDAITGIIGRKDWDFAAYGAGPAAMALGGTALLLVLMALYFSLPVFRPNQLEKNPPTPA